MYGDILVPTDGSDAVSGALGHALSIAEPHGATIHALNVVDARLTAAASEEARDERRRSLEAEGEEAVDAVDERVSRSDVRSVTAIRHGTPWRTILEYADEADVDLIVIASHGKSPREKLTSMGSVSERVVDNATVPVLVVRGAEGRDG